MAATMPTTPEAALAAALGVAPTAQAGGEVVSINRVENRRIFARYSHEALADAKIANPLISQKELADMFGYSQSYISTLMCSDAFQEIYAKRRGETADPLIKEELEARFKAVTQRSLDVLQRKLELPATQISDALLLKAIELGAKGSNIGGFAAAAPVAPPAAPAADRLVELAKRLEALSPRRAPLPEVETVEPREPKAAA